MTIFLEPDESWLIKAGTLEEGQALCFSYQERKMGARGMTEVLEIQYPGRGLRVTSMHGTTTVIERAGPR